MLIHLVVSARRMEELACQIRIKLDGPCSDGGIDALADLANAGIRNAA